MTNEPTDKPQSQQQTPAPTQQPQVANHQPNRDIQPPQYQIATEGYDPRIDLDRLKQKGKSS